MYKINIAMIFMFTTHSAYACQERSLQSARKSIREQLECIHRDLASLKVLDEAIAETQQVASTSMIEQRFQDDDNDDRAVVKKILNFKKACQVLELNDSMITPTQVKQAYFQAIAKKTIDKSWLKLEWHEYVEVADVYALYTDIDKAYKYFSTFFIQKNNLVKQITSMHEQRLQGETISDKDSNELLESIQWCMPEALAFMDDDVFRKISYGYLKKFTVHQLAILSKPKVEIIKNDIWKWSRLNLEQRRALKSNPHYTASAPAAASTADIARNDG